MGFMDKLKASAEDIAAEAKKAGAQAQVKAGEVQARRRADAAAQKLGYLIYREKTQGTPAGSAVDVLIEEITSHQSQIRTHVADDPSETSSPGNPPTSAPGSTPAGVPVPVGSSSPQDTPPNQSEPFGDTPEAPDQSEPAEK